MIVLLTLFLLIDQVLWRAACRWQVDQEELVWKHLTYQDLPQGKTK